METDLQKLRAIADKLFSIWRSKYRMYQLYRAEWDDVENARIAYELAENNYQHARKQAGMIYLLTGEM